MDRAANAAGLAVSTATSEPETAAGSRPRTTSRSAAIDTYSAPWIPAVTATRGPGRDPCTIATGTSRVPVPRSTGTMPVTLVPGSALRAPIVIAAVVMVPRVALGAAVEATVR